MKNMKKNSNHKKIKIIKIKTMRNTKCTKIIEIN